ncbi:hypothetical protein, partial [Stutzerimonas stutzeri]|uniref:hypothetical protein n=1 Tax=Stutzerimonas stutzeri TaxID=316 RepID=UPI00210DD815
SAGLFIGANMNNEAKIHLSLRDGTFEISGSENFVSQQIENFKDLILDSIRTPSTPPYNLEKTSPQPTSQEVDQNSAPTAKVYNRVLHIEDKSVKIIKKVPGINNAKKTVNTALIYLWGCRSAGVNEVSLHDIRRLCQEQSCLDSSNFSSYISGAKELIIVEGKKGSSSKSCKLTIPGIEKAEELLESLNNV